MICFSRNDLERIAGKVVAAYMRSITVPKEDVYQIDPEYVARNQNVEKCSHYCGDHKVLFNAGALGKYCDGTSRIQLAKALQ